MDELAHIPAGYSYVKYFDYRLNPEHPPLVKALSALPLLFQKLNFPTDSPYWQKDINGQWAVGTQFLYEYGNDADKIINWARFAPMILTLILILFVYIWAKELLGKWWALVPTILTAFSPTILAHGHYVTTDIGATLGTFISIYYFVKYLLRQNAKNLIISGIALGIALLMKFSTVLLLPLFVFLALIYAILETRDYAYEKFAGKILWFFKDFLKYTGILIGIFAVAYILVYAVYLVFTINYPIEKQVADTKYTLASFGDGPDINFETCKITSSIPLSKRSRCLAEINIWMSGNKIFRPLGEYLLGVLMVIQRSAGGNTAYFLGEVSASGSWYYFPVVFLLKEPIPSLILIALAIFVVFIKFIKNFNKASLKERFFTYLDLNFAEFSMLSFVIFYWLYSIRSPLNIGVRHILPTVPFIYILITEAIKNWTRRKTIISDSFIKNFLKQIFRFLKTSSKAAFIFILIAWYLMETLVNAPYFLSYFNEFGGGTFDGYKYVTDSNYDWGQDLKRLKNFIDDKKINKIAVDYFGGGNPKYYLNDTSTSLNTSKVEYWQSSKGNPKYEGINWLAVSINTLQSAIEKLHLGQQRNPEDEYRWLIKIKDVYKPDYRAGTSIFIYKLN